MTKIKIITIQILTRRLVRIIMDNSITWTEKLYKGHWLMDLGYRDYIAARLLLNNHMIIQGLTLASTSVEKYLKALIVFNLKER